MLQIKNHKLVGIPFIPTKNMSGIINPNFVVEHYTAGWTAQVAIDRFKTPSSKVSAHLVVDRDGAITQMVPFNRKAWHAGPSKYAGYNGMNSHAIGIENVNIGYFTKTNNGWMDPYGTVRSENWLISNGYNPDSFVAAKNSRLGSGVYYWPSYTDAQLEANDQLIAALAKQYDIKDVVTHEEIDTRGWKTDPGPAFPMKRYKDIIRNGDRSKDTKDDEQYRVIVTTETLNVRSGPGTQWDVFGTLKRGDNRLVLEKDGEWLRLALSHDREGWVHGRYTERAV